MKVTDIFSGLALIISLLSFWLAFRNREERKLADTHSLYIECYAVLDRAMIIMTDSDVVFREFWRLCLSHAYLKCNDFDQVIERIKCSTASIKTLKAKLEEEKDDPRKLKNLLALSKGIVFESEPFRNSLREDLRNLEKEISLSISKPEQERVPNLRNVISQIKQWESSNKPLK